MNFTETAHVMACRGEELCAVLTRPDQAARTGILVVVGGPQYRVGSHRQFVLLCRALAAEGIAALRFDRRGMGDSSGTQISFEDIADDIAAAVELFAAQMPALERVLMLGLCDAASAALIYCGERRDPRIKGLVLLNPWVRSEASLAATHVRHYYLQRVLEGDFWRKLLAGKVNPFLSLGSFLASVRAARRGAGAAGFRQAMAEGWRGFAGPILLILSGRDFTALEFLQQAKAEPLWQGLLARPGLTRRDLPEADHTFSSTAWRREVETWIVDWVRRSFPSEPAA